MTDGWKHFPHKTIEGSGYGMMDFDQIHSELAKPDVNLSLLHHEYEVLCWAQGRMPYPYRSFLRHYKNYADKYNATMRIHRKPGELLEVDWIKSEIVI